MENTRRILCKKTKTYFLFQTKIHLSVSLNLKCGNLRAFENLLCVCIVMDVLCFAPFVIRLTSTELGSFALNARFQINKHESIIYVKHLGEQACAHPHSGSLSSPNKHTHTTIDLRAHNYETRIECTLKYLYRQKLCLVMERTCEIVPHSMHPAALLRAARAHKPIVSPRFESAISLMVALFHVAFTINVF